LSGFYAIPTDDAFQRTGDGTLRFREIHVGI
jgi:hypothetical protein